MHHLLLMAWLLAANGAAGEERPSRPQPIPADQVAAAAWPERERQVESARQAGARLASGDKSLAVRDGRRLHLVNRLVLVTADANGEGWEATWLGSVKAAIRGARFGLDIPGAPLPLQAAKADTGPFSDKLGTGVEIRHHWSGQVRLERRLRIYDGKPGLSVSAAITNASDRPINLRSELAPYRWGSPVVGIKLSALSY